jgi:hypothetical protein
MKKESGILNVLVIPVVVLGVLVVGLVAFGAWSYQKYQDYKNNTDQKVSVAVDDAKTRQKQQLQAQFLEEEKKPTRKFSSPSTLGTVSFQYPKTWSVYVANDAKTDDQYDAYFNPEAVQPVQNDLQHPSALHVVVSTQEYSSILSNYTAMVQQKKLTAVPIQLKAGNGMRFDGTFSDSGFQGAQIVFPLRDKTVQIYAENKQFIGDFNNIIIPSLNFIP